MVHNVVDGELAIARLLAGKLRQPSHHQRPPRQHHLAGLASLQKPSQGQKVLLDIHSCTKASLPFLARFWR
jgi:hypothetical protein